MGLQAMCRHQQDFVSDSHQVSQYGHMWAAFPPYTNDFKLFYCTLNISSPTIASHQLVAEGFREEEKVKEK